VASIRTAWSARGDVDVVEERVEALAGEDLDPVRRVEDLAHRRVGGA